MNKCIIGIVQAVADKGVGYIGDSLDLAELLSVLYSDFMRFRPKEPSWTDRDFLICSIDRYSDFRWPRQKSLFWAHTIRLCWNTRGCCKSCIISCIRRIFISYRCCIASRWRSITIIDYKPSFYYLSKMRLEWWLFLYPNMIYKNLSDFSFLMYLRLLSLIFYKNML